MGSYKFKMCCFPLLPTAHPTLSHCFDSAVSNSRHLGAYALSPDALMASAKFKVLSEMLPDLRQKGSKVLLFSQWTQASVLQRVQAITSHSQKLCMALKQGQQGAIVLPVGSGNCTAGVASFD